MTRDELVADINWEKGFGHYLSVPDSWLPEIERTHLRLKELDPDYTVAQIKSKFGGLRYYADSELLGWDAVHEITSECERAIGFDPDVYY